MTITRFEDIKAWQLAQDLAVLIYRASEGMSDFSFRNQICKAAVSISNNIAEGFQRGSDKDFIRFLRIARGSGQEVKSMLYLGKRLGYFTTEQVEPIFDLSTQISVMLHRFIVALQSNSPPVATK